MVHNSNENIFKTNISVCSVKNIDALNLIKNLKPEGTKKIAQATVDRPIKEVEKEIISSVKKQLDKIF